MYSHKKRKMNGTTNNTSTNNNNNNSQYHFHFVYYLPTFIIPQHSNHHQNRGAAQTEPQPHPAQTPEQQPQQQQQQQFFWTTFYPFMFHSAAGQPHAHAAPTANSGDYINNDQLFNQFLAQMFSQHQQQQQQQQLQLVKCTKKCVMDQLPVYTCDMQDSYQSQFGDSNVDCSVCLCESENGDQLLRLPCTHTFHKSCIEPWLKSNHTCPVCRYELPLQLTVPEEKLQNRQLSVQDIKSLNRQSEELNKQIEQRMLKEYGPDSLRLMQLGNDIQQVYSRIQRLEQEQQQEQQHQHQQQTSILNSIEVSLNQTMDKLDSVIIPVVVQNDDENGMQDAYEVDQQAGQSTKYTWDWSKIRQVRRQLVHRIQALLTRVDQLRLGGAQAQHQDMSSAMTD